MADEVMEKEFRIGNRYGLHGRTSARLVETARRFEADVRLIRDGEAVDCKSILDVLTLACGQGTPVTIRIEGPDARVAMAALEQLVENRFDEE
ncbi:MAG TPA: HPr family phosphocarrier protein [Desulfurivibrionaceae bacterium]|nr:HPr family phosphocarrier protein [Desulfurivibrionaceae bacterium]